MGSDLAPDRRRELERLLAQRARLLAPRPETITRGLRRCAKHAPRDGDQAVVGGEGAPRHGTAATLPLPPGSSTRDLDEVEISAAATDDLRVATAVAAAPTVAEDENIAEDDPVLDGARKSGPIPAMIKRGKETIRGYGRGSVIGGYRIEGILGVGGMGQVYRATQLRMNREVAFKVLPERLAENPGFRERFLREARNAGRLQHPHLIAVHDVEDADGILFFSMELVEGTTVRRMIKDNGKIAEERALVIVRQALDALRYAHGQGLIHRDIKPDNIMVTETGQVKLADLGLSRITEGDADEDSGITQSGTMMGTPFYMAPEQGRDAHKADCRSDIYSLGATLYHMVCGQVPFRGSSAMDVLVRAATQPLAYPDDHPPSKGLRRLIERLMDKDPNARPQSAADALVLVDALGHPATTHGSTHFSDEHHPSHRRGGGLFAWIVAGVLGLVVVAGLLYGLTRMLAHNEWEAKKREVGIEVQHSRYHLAADLLDRYAAANPDFAAEAATIRSTVVGQWDDYAQEHLSAQFQEIDEHIFRRRYERASAQLDGLAADEAWASPWARSRIEALRAEIQAAISD